MMRTLLFFILSLLAASIDSCATSGIVQAENFDRAVVSINQQLEGGPFGQGLPRLEAIGRCEADYSELLSSLDSVLRGYTRADESVMLDFEENALGAAEVPAHDEDRAGHFVHWERSIRISLARPAVAFLTGTEITSGKARPQYAALPFLDIRVAPDADEHTVLRLISSLNEAIEFCQRARRPSHVAGPPITVPVHFPERVAFRGRSSPAALIIGMVPGSLSLPGQSADPTSVEFFEGMALDPMLRFSLDLPELASTMERAASTLGLEVANVDLRIEPANTRLTRLVVNTLGRVKPPLGPGYVVFAEAVSGDWLLPVYFDRPCRVTGRAPILGTQRSFNIVVMHAGLHWVRIPSSGQGAVVVEDAVPSVQLLVDADAP